MQLTGGEGEQFAAAGSRIGSWPPLALGEARGGVHGAVRAGSGCGSPAGHLARWSWPHRHNGITLFG
jgi:hypothetical protein